MILYKAAKYLILDYCIVSLFDKLSRNLHLHKKDSMHIKDVEMGMRFSVIRRDFGLGNCYDCYDCAVLSTGIFDAGVLDTEQYYFLEFEFKESNYITTGSNFHYMKIPVSKADMMEFIQ